jgi:hypothetical protein
LEKKDSSEDLAVVDFLAGDFWGDLVGVLAMVDEARRLRDGLLGVCGWRCGNQLVVMLNSGGDVAVG